MESLKIVIFGCGNWIAPTIISVEAENATVVGVVTMPESELPTGCVPFVGKHRVIEHQKTSVEYLWLLDELKADLAFIVGFPKLLDQKILELFPFGIIGCHPTPLPLGKGRHPIHWLLCMDIRTSALTFFKLTDKADSGPIVLRTKLKLFPTDTIATVNARLSNLIAEGYSRIIKSRLFYSMTEQQTSFATEFPARTRFDCIIDPRMSSHTIVNHVRSFVAPFPGCRLHFGPHEFVILSASLVSASMDDLWQPIGKVISIDDNTVCMRVEDGVVKMSLQGPMEILKGLPVIKTPLEYNTNL